MINKNLTQAELRRLLCYNPFSGNFMWKVSLSRSIRIGSIAGTFRGGSKRSRKDIAIRIDGIGYSAHRLTFLYMRGYWPRDQVDHRDGDSLNNRWLNLRECTQSQNNINSKVYRTNKLGIRGVHRTKNGKYCAILGKDSKKIHYSKHDTVEDAARAYRKAAKKYFGEFARHV